MAALSKKLHLALVVFVGLFASFSANAQPDPGYKRIEDVIYGRKFGTALTLDVFEPTHPNGCGVIFLVSGAWHSQHDATPEYGSWPVVNADNIRLFLDRGYTVFAVVHSSLPRFFISDMVQDLLRAVRFIRHNAGAYGVDPNHLGITGSSSGGQLALMVATKGGDGIANAPDPVDRESSAVQAAGVFFPLTDFTNYGAPGVDAADVSRPPEVLPWILRAAFGPRSETPEDRRIYEMEISPAYFVTSRLPPVVIIHGDADPVVPIQQSELFIQKARDAGAKLPELVVRHGKGHGWGKDGELKLGNFWQSKEDIKVFTDWFDHYLRNTPKPGALAPAEHSP